MPSSPDEKNRIKNFTLIVPCLLFFAYRPSAFIWPPVWKQISPSNIGFISGMLSTLAEHPLPSDLMFGSKYLPTLDSFLGCFHISGMSDKPRGNGEATHLSTNPSVDESTFHQRLSADCPFVPFSALRGSG
ncbi:hypothetical protein CEXT_619901 [Caerostris extrusa]|uniref:Uncharacterized protein n=1 Tax=Caerostris extrusa TaxID=172846 RepID=A0AAV4R4B7_CAEEX|nr:hypothetical protein CEXT_619901 [Caerostris extrusa]